MKKTFFMLLTLLCVSTASGQEKEKVAIYTTDNSGQNIVEFVGDFLTNAIVKRGSYLAVERTAEFLKALGKEQNYQQSGSVDDNQISKLGRQMGVQYVCVVKIGKSGTQLFLSARLIDVEAATLKATASPVRFNVNDWDEIEKLCERVTASMFGERVNRGGASSNSNVPRGNTQRHPAEPEMVQVQGGTFWMGCTQEQGSDCWANENPLHRVTVRNFSIGKYEVTQAQWKLIMGSNPSNFKGDNLPVEKVSWNDAQEFISRLNALSGKSYRLPTEAEWEYAARGGSQSQGYKYSGSNKSYNVSWFEDNSSNATHVVGTKLPNELGLYDMSGNVWEWCRDWYDDYSTSQQRDPMGASSGSGRVLRSGSWFNTAQLCRVSIRSSTTPTNSGNHIGFRLVLP